MVSTPNTHERQTEMARGTRPSTLFPPPAQPRLASSSFIEGEDTLPVVLHADHDPAVLLRLVVERLRKGANLGVGESLCGTIGILALGVIVQQQHREPLAIAGHRVLEHLPV